MNSPLQPYRFKAPALYNPRLWQANEVRAYYVARLGLLSRIVDDLKREDASNRPQHRLIVGLRGMGKSTLLRRLAVAIEDDQQLNADWLPLSFPEEQYNVATLSDFWLNCLDALSDLLESRGQTAESENLDQEVEKLDRKDGEGALNTLLRSSAKMQRRLVLLVDNIDLVFDRIKDEDWKLREVLQAHPEILIVGASAKALEASYNYQAAFYDFFKIDELKGLSEAEMRETIVNLARLNQAEHIIRRIDADPARLKVLHTLTGGNPRTAVLLYGVLLKGIDGDVRSDLEGLLDEVTPLYKARFEELPAQSQQMLDKLALHWHPASAAVLAEQLGWKVNLVSAQLDRLISAGIVERVKAPYSKRLNFQIGERFFNIWYLMRTSRRLRRKLIWLVECLRGLYDSAELQALARKGLERGANDLRDAETLLALGEVVGEPAFKRALTTRALEALIAGIGGAKLSDLFDLDGDDHALKDRVEKIAARKSAKEALQNRLSGTGYESLIDLLDRALLSSADYQRVTEHLTPQNKEFENARKLISNVAESNEKELGKKVVQILSEAFACGEMDSLDDIDGGKAAAQRFNNPVISLVPLALSDPLTDTEDSELEQYYRRILDFDRTGTLFPYALYGAQLTQGKKADALKSLHELASLKPAGADWAARLASAFLFHDNAHWLHWASAAIDKQTQDEQLSVERLSGLAQTAVAKGKATNLLQLIDNCAVKDSYLPLREALNAVAQNDPTLLELLAPEVRLPAQEFLAIIAPGVAKPV